MMRPKILLEVAGAVAMLLAAREVGAEERAELQSGSHSASGSPQASVRTLVYGESDRQNVTIDNVQRRRCWYDGNRGWYGNRPNYGARFYSSYPYYYGRPYTSYYYGPSYGYYYTPRWTHRPGY